MQKAIMTRQATDLVVAGIVLLLFEVDENLGNAGVELLHRR
jgi:hypothetical protein